MTDWLTSGWAGVRNNRRESLAIAHHAILPSQTWPRAEQTLHLFALSFPISVTDNKSYYTMSSFFLPFFLFLKKRSSSTIVGQGWLVRTGQRTERSLQDDTGVLTKVISCVICFRTQIKAIKLNLRYIHNTYSTLSKILSIICFLKLETVSVLICSWFNVMRREHSTWGGEGKSRWQ